MSVSQNLQKMQNIQKQKLYIKNTFYTPCGHQIVVMNPKRWSHESYGS